MSLNALEGGVLVNKKTLIDILQVCRPKKITSENNMYDVGYEAAKADMAAILGKHFNLHLALNPADDFIRALKNG